ncbi:Diacylglycerol kinase catalytic domain [Phytophthora infestans]|uniref:Diacylglycerol kinase catalytic domain n=1 Tax=Phytophthora infestans TaxID=4787 RepID=A0A8S9V716_PHYIN|nr:Diacylglycerol kinase catalytic domain [Phytophthora infestans]
MAVLPTHARDDELDHVGPVKIIEDENQLFHESQPALDDSDEEDTIKTKRLSSDEDDVKDKRLSNVTAASSDGEVLTGEDRDRIREVRERVLQDAANRPPVSPAKNHFRRAMTVAVPSQGLVPRKDAPEHDNDSGSKAGETPSSLRLMRSKSWAGCPQRDAALEAIENRQVQFRFSTAASAREIVREMHSHRLREFPEQCVMSAQMEMQIGSVWRKMTVQVDRDGLNCQRVSLFRKKTKELQIFKDDLLAASLTPGSKTSVDVHFMLPGRGKEHRRLMRRYRTITLRFNDETTAAKLVTSLQMFVKWMARVPENVTRRIKVVVNPHSGRRRGRKVWEHWRTLLELANIQCDVEETQYSGHARDIGAAFDLDMKYEAIVFVGGDGTVNEFMNGVFSREESVWRTLVATTPVSLICAGTDNAFGKGVGTPTHASSVYCIIKRKIRPLDVMTCQASNDDGSTRLEFACTGVSYGIGSDIAVESEATRWLGVHRYFYLKVKRGLFAPHKHEAKISYVLSDNVPVDPNTGEQILRTYYEIMDDTAEDQHHVERCSIYDDTDPAAKQWKGDAESIFHPASEEKYAGKWHSFSSELTSAGGSNVYFETKYAHPSDGNLDLIYSRKGNISQTAEIAVRYLSNTFLKSELVGYHKVKAMVIEPIVEDVLNVDGEVFAGPGPFRVEVVPQLLCVLSEK